MTIFVAESTPGRLFTEAWIETCLVSLRYKGAGRLFTEAWIETWATCARPTPPAVASSRRRGLKHVECLLAGDDLVASSRRRGLKLDKTADLLVSLESPLHGGVD